MKLTTLKTLWDKYAGEWYKKDKVNIDGQLVPVSDLCSLKKSYEKILLQRYDKMKEIVKQSYFGNNIKHVNRYKRAAILAYVISSAEPIEFNKAVPFGADEYFLKQRLAFYVAIGSIISDFPKDKVEAIQGDLYDFYDLGFLNDKGANPSQGSQDRDDFLTSVYKDLFFSEIYQNYNVLTMANVFGLLTEKSSKLAGLR